MIQFFLKGLLRDRSRSFFPVLTVAAGVSLTVLLHAYIEGVSAGMIRTTAHYQTGHVKIMTRAYATEADQVPNDLALTGVGELIHGLNREFPEIVWTPRIKFGGILDIPDENGETKEQGPVSGMAVDLFSKTSPEQRLLNIDKAIVRGQLPSHPGEILVADDFAEKLNIDPGDMATLLSSTMHGSMSMANFKIAGTVTFGVAAMDKGAVLADIADIQYALDMDDAAGEILGFFPGDAYHDARAVSMANRFNIAYKKSNDPFSPQMGTLPRESGLEDYIRMIDAATLFILAVFITAMSIVLWNAGLMGSLRRYGEIGVRLAIGEHKGHVYLTLIMESVMIGIAGSVIGTAAGLAAAYWMQVYGIDVGFLLKNSSMMISNVLRARVTAGSFFIGFIPGILATVLGAAIAGIGIFKRQTSQLFKELEA